MLEGSTDLLAAALEDSNVRLMVPMYCATHKNVPQAAVSELLRQAREEIRILSTHL